VEAQEFGGLNDWICMVLWEFAWKSASKIDVKSTRTTAYTCALASTMRNPKEPFVFKMLSDLRPG